MAVTQDRYQSNYGWAMSVPAGWQLLPSSPGQVLAAHRPVVFCNDENYDLWLTWMVAAHPIKVEVVEKFEAVVKSDNPQQADLAALAPTLFPVIGKIDSCELVALADGARAIEVVETYEEEDGRKGGYQLILPLRDVPGMTRVFQRVCFYAPWADFDRHLPDIRQAARSFRYTRPYGWQ